MSTAYPDTQLLIDGQWQDAASGKQIDVRNPATGEVIGHVAHADIPDLDRALAAADKGFKVWRKMSAHERGAIMRKAASLLKERADEIAALKAEHRAFAGLWAQLKPQLEAVASREEQHRADAPTGYALLGSWRRGF